MAIPKGIPKHFRLEIPKVTQMQKAITTDSRMDFQTDFHWDSQKATQRRLGKVTVIQTDFLRDFPKVTPTDSQRAILKDFHSGSHSHLGLVMGFLTDFQKDSHLDSLTVIPKETLRLMEKVRGFHLDFQKVIQMVTLRHWVIMKEILKATPMAIPTGFRWHLAITRVIPKVIHSVTRTDFLRATRMHSVIVMATQRAIRTDSLMETQTRLVIMKDSLKEIR